MKEKKFTRVEADDPNRCQAVHATQQCPFRAVGDFDTATQTWTGPKYCPRHGGSTQTQQAKEEEKRMYLSAKWKAKIGTNADNPRIKSLAEEIGIIRMTLEAKLNLITDEKELVMQAAGIVALTNSVKDLVKTWQHVEERSNQVLDRTKLTGFVNSLIGILTRYIDDVEILQMIGEDMLETIEKAFAQKL